MKRINEVLMCKYTGELWLRTNLFNSIAFHVLRFNDYYILEWDEARFISLGDL